MVYCTTNVTQNKYQYFKDYEKSSYGDIGTKVKTKYRK